MTNLINKVINSWLPRHLTSIKVALLIGALSISLTTLFQNCGGMNPIVINDLPLPAHGVNSPFSGDKLHLSNAFVAKTAAAGASYLASRTSVAFPAGTVLNFIVNDTCLINRNQKRQPKPIFFIDKYVPPSLFSGTSEKFDDTVLAIVLRSDVSLDGLKRALNVDPCLIGASDPRNASGGLAAATYNDPGYPSQQNVMTAIRFSGADSFFQTEVPTSQVNVATIDTGFDLTNTDKGTVVTLPGSDPFGLSDIPQDTAGHGTQVGSLINAIGNNALGVVGLAFRNTKLFPIRAFDGQGKPPARLQGVGGWIFENVKRAVNSNAEVINLSFSYTSQGCDPVVGYALYKAIANGSFFTIAAGQGIKRDSAGNDIPGLLVAPKENGPLYESDDAFPACWGRYFKGAVTVGALTTGTHALAPFSNWGGDAVEIAAPGTAVNTFDLNNNLVTVNGTSFASAQVAATAALIIAYHKAKGWSYTPWLIEDILLNGSPTDSTLASAAQSVHNGRYLDMKSIADYLGVLATKTADERRHEPSEDPEDGVIITSGAGDPSMGTLTRLEVYSDSPLVQNSDRSQLQAVAYFSNGSYEVVTSNTAFTSGSPGVLTIGSGGVAYPVIGAVGAATVTGTYLGRSASYTLSVVNFNVVNGLNAVPISLEMVAKGTYLNALAHYSDGSIRDVSQDVSWSTSTSMLHVVFGDGFLNWDVKALGGTSATVTALYRGLIAQQTFVKAVCPMKSHSMYMADGITSQVITSVTEGEPLGFNDMVNQGLELSAICTGLDQDFLGFYFGNNYTLTFSSPQAVMDAALKSNQTQTVLAGTYTVVINGTFYGGTTPVDFTDQITFPIVASPVTSIQFSAVDQGYVGYNPFNAPHASGAEFKAQLVHQNGIITQTGTYVWTLTDSAGNSQPSLSKPMNWINSLADSANLANQAHIYLFSAAIGETYTVTVRETVSGLSASHTVTVGGGLNHYTGTYQTAQLPSLTTPTRAPTTAGDSPLCTGAALTNKIGGGDGTSANPYLICTPNQLFATGTQTPLPGQPTLYYQLGKSLDLSSLGNVATRAIDGVTNPIDFDGMNRSISNLTMVDTASAWDTGLFSRVHGGHVRNLLLINPTMSGGNQVGALAGGFDGQISHCIVIGGNISGVTYVGGLVGSVGQGSLLIDQSFVLSSQVSLSTHIAGGLIGGNYGGQQFTISGSGAEVSINNSGPPGYGNSLGGLIGESVSSSGAPCLNDADFGKNCPLIVSSYAKGNIHKGHDGVGGLIGLNATTVIIDSAAAVDVEGQGTGTGGLVGISNGSASGRGSGASGYDFSGLIYGSLATGQVVGGNLNTGGLVGYSNLQIIEKSSASGNVTGGSVMGGLIGESNGFNQIYNCTTTSTVIGSGSNVAGFIGMKSALVDLENGAAHNVDDLYSGNNWNKSMNSSLQGVGSYLGSLRSVINGISP